MRTLKNNYNSFSTRYVLWKGIVEKMKVIKNIIKNILKIMYIFPIDNKKIFIDSFGGKSKYGFDGRALIEYSNKQNLGYKFIGIKF